MSKGNIGIASVIAIVVVTLLACVLNVSDVVFDILMLIDIILVGVFVWALNSNK